MSRINLPESLNSYGQPNFKNVLADELCQNAYDLPLDEFCGFGGWPDQETLDISVLTQEEKGDKVKVVVQCDFKEAVPTGCSDCPMTEHAVGELTIIFDLQNNTAHLGDEEWDADMSPNLSLPFD